MFNKLHLFCGSKLFRKILTRKYERKEVVEGRKCKTKYSALLFRLLKGTKIKLFSVVLR